MFSWKRFFAILNARNTEFVRDRSALGWNIILPVLLVAGFAFLFSKDSHYSYKVAVYSASFSGKNSAEFEFGSDAKPIKDRHKGAISQSKINKLLNELREEYNFFHSDFIQLSFVVDLAKSIEKIKHHQYDMVIDVSKKSSVKLKYWINSSSLKGEVLEKVLWGTQSIEATRLVFDKQTVEGLEIRYIDWVLPGILGMNMMFSCLFGIGYVIVRYRKNGVLKRFKGTPLTALEFVTAQIASRLILICVITVAVFIGCNFFIDFNVVGSYLNLFIIFLFGALSLISLALIIAARTSSEEFANGVLNLLSWPMLIFSGVWFSLEGLHPSAQAFANLLPLTHMIEAARQVMNDGASLAQVSDHLLVLGSMTLVFISIAAFSFRWERD